MNTRKSKPTYILEDSTCQRFSTGYVFQGVSHAWFGDRDGDVSRHAVFVKTEGVLPQKPSVENIPNERHVKWKAVACLEDATLATYDFSVKFRKTIVFIIILNLLSPARFQCQQSQFGKSFLNNSKYAFDERKQPITFTTVHKSPPL